MLSFSHPDSVSIRRPEPEDKASENKKVPKMALFRDVKPDDVRFGALDTVSFEHLLGWLDQLRLVFAKDDSTITGLEE